MVLCLFRILSSIDSFPHQLTGFIPTLRVDVRQWQQFLFEVCPDAPFLFCCSEDVAKLVLMYEAYVALNVQSPSQIV
jgi:hypothetical protein